MIVQSSATFRCFPLMLFLVSCFQIIQYQLLKYIQLSISRYFPLFDPLISARFPLLSAACFVVFFANYQYFSSDLEKLNLKKDPFHE